MPDAASRSGTPRLEILKTLGDNTRYAIYLEMARSPRPLATAEIAETLDLHPNTVRPHLERMRDLGIVDVTAAATGAVGRPQHRYAIADDAPSLGLEPPVFPLVTRILLTGAAAGGLDPDDLAEAGREQGSAAAGATSETLACADALERELAGLGFDPARVDDDDSVTIAFAHCPFRELAEAHPDLVCSMHRGMVEGFVAARGDATVTDFHPLTDRTPCQVELHTAPSRG
ncbi:helix-turn-helix transcriptional regulator [Actinospongicola halichondriae]|uniref:helix-turn-helix transcriptional regulator n=1 Tax=Actinospongicola halichondriae TaxID=3236844 RepID=UPI003D4BCA58